MTKAELVAAMALKAGLKRNQAKEALDALVGCVTDEVKAGREVRIVGFGAFTPVQRGRGRGAQSAHGTAGPKTGVPHRTFPPGRRA